MTALKQYKSITGADASVEVPKLLIPDVFIGFREAKVW